MKYIICLTLLTITCTAPAEDKAKHPFQILDESIQNLTKTDDTPKFLTKWNNTSVSIKYTGDRQKPYTAEIQTEEEFIAKDSMSPEGIKKKYTISIEYFPGNPETYPDRGRWRLAEAKEGANSVITGVYRERVLEKDHDLILICSGLHMHRYYLPWEKGYTKDLFP